MDIAAVRAALAEAASTVAGLACHGYMPDDITEPALCVGEVEIAYDQTYGRGMDRLTVTCYVFASRADDVSGQRLIDGYLAGSGPASLKAAIEADRVLGGACHDVRVASAEGYGTYDYGAVKYVGAKITVHITGPGG